MKFPIIDKYDNAYLWPLAALTNQSLTGWHGYRIAPMGEVTLFEVQEQPGQWLIYSSGSTEAEAITKAWQRFTESTRAKSAELEDIDSVWSLLDQNPSNPETYNEAARKLTAIARGLRVAAEIMRRSDPAKTR